MILDSKWHLNSSPESFIDKRVDQILSTLWEEPAQKYCDYSKHGHHYKRLHHWRWTLHY